MTTKPNPPERGDASGALKAFTEYFVRNYPGPDTIISDPLWHAPRIFRAAQSALSTPTPAPSEGDATLQALALVRGMAEHEPFVMPAQHGKAVCDDYARAKEIAAALSNIGVAARGDGWQPIETAPKWRQRILGWNAEYGMRETCMMHYQVGSPGFAQHGPAECGWEWIEEKHNAVHTWSPTHWRPLPEPPSTPATMRPEEGEAQP